MARSALVAILCLAMSLPAYAHSGGTDAFGCHNSSSGRHCHGSSSGGGGGSLVAGLVLVGLLGASLAVVIWAEGQKSAGFDASPGCAGVFVRF